MKPKAIYKHLKPRKWYNDLYDKIVKEEVDRQKKNPIKYIIVSL